MRARPASRPRVVDARVWGGIHFRTADEQGATMGKQIAQWIKTRYFEPRR
jgi:hypothetical protein